MKKIKSALTYFISLCLLASIFSFTVRQSRRLDPVAYTQWVINPQNGLQAKITEGAYDFIVNYLPTEYMIIKEAQSKTISKKEFVKRQKELKNVEYYSLLIDLNNGKKNTVKSLIADTKVPANDMVKYLAYDLQHDVQLVTGTDTLKCAFFHFEDTYEVTSYVRFLAVFDVPDNDKKDDRVIHVSLPWMNERTLKFVIPKKNLLSVPKVSVKK